MLEQTDIKRFSNGYLTDETAEISRPNASNGLDLHLAEKGGFRRLVPDV
jgi:hypothetical protein